MILAIFFLAFVVMIYGVIPWQDLGLPIPTWWWWFPEMTACFLFFGILIGIIGRLSEKDLVNTFIDGAKDMLGVALIIGVTSGITVIMNNGLITDTVLYWAEQADFWFGRRRFYHRHLLALPAALVPDPLQLRAGDSIHADYGGIRLICQCTQLPGGDGVPDCQRVGQPDHPTWAVVMGGLAIARVGYGVWWKFVWPLLLLLIALSIIVLAGGVLVAG